MPYPFHLALSEWTPHLHASSFFELVLVQQPGATTSDKALEHDCHIKILKINFFSEFKNHSALAFIT
jgi:hypothetical protein